MTEKKFTFKDARESVRYRVYDERGAMIGVVTRGVYPGARWDAFTPGGSSIYDEHGDIADYATRAEAAAAIAAHRERHPRIHARRYSKR